MASSSAFSLNKLHFPHPPKGLDGWAGEKSWERYAVREFKIAVSSGHCAGLIRHAVCASRAGYPGSAATKNLTVCFSLVRLTCFLYEICKDDRN